MVSPAEMHDHLRTVIVAPTAIKSRPAPFGIPVTHGRQKGLILLDQVSAVDKVRLAKRLGTVSSKALAGTLGQVAGSVRRVRRKGRPPMSWERPNFCV